MQGLMVGFDVARPTDVDGVLAALADGGPDAKILAGGTDLLIQLRFGAIHPTLVVDLGGVSSLKTLHADDSGGVWIGAGATVSVVESAPELTGAFVCLRESALQLGSRQIRNTATVVGNICHCSPSAEFAPPLIALGALAHIEGAQGKRVVALEDFAIGPGNTVLEPGDIVTALHLPPPPARAGAAYDCLKIRKLMDIAIVSAAACVTLADDGTCAAVRLVLGAVAAVPVRAGVAENRLLGRRLTPELLESAALAAGEAASPITDVRASLQYREAMVVRSALRALSMAAIRASSGLRPGAA